MKILLLSSHYLDVYAYGSDHSMGLIIEKPIEGEIKSDQFFEEIFSGFSQESNGEDEKYCVVYSTLESDPNLVRLSNFIESRSGDELSLKIPLIQCILWSNIENHEQQVITIETGLEDSAIHYHLPGKKQHNRLIRNRQYSYRGFLKMFSKGFEKELDELGYEYKESEIDLFELRRALEANLSNWQQKKVGKYVKLLITYQLHPDAVKSALQKTNRSLKNYITDDIFENRADNLVILLGHYGILAHTTEYIKQQFPNTGFNVISIGSKQQIIESLRLGLKRYFTFESNKLRKAQLEEESKLVLARNKIIQEIQSLQIEQSSRDEVIQSFFVEAQNADMPIEILTWHIDSRIKSLHLQTELYDLENSIEQEELPYVLETVDPEKEYIAENTDNGTSEESTDSIIVDDEEIEEKASEENLIDIELPIDFYSEEEETESEPDPTPIGTQESEIVKKLNPFQVSDFEWPEDQNDSLQLENIIETEKIFPNSEFILLKGKLKGSEILRVFRIISTSELENIENLQKFRRLYERESNYYTDVSKVFRSNFGLFYYRKFFEGVSLESGIQQLGLDKIDNLENAESVHLKLIFQLWKTVKSLEFSMTDFNAKNFIILSDLEKKIEPELKILLVGFKSQVSTKKEMEDRMHDMLFDLLDNNFYQQFLDKFY